MTPRGACKRLALLTCSLSLAAGAWASAEAGTNRPLVGSRTPGVGAKVRRLGDYAGWVRLNRELVGDTSSGGIVISDANLREVASRGRVSTGGGVTVPLADFGKVADQTAAADQWRRSYQEQEAKVRGLQNNLASYEREVAGNRTPYESAAPQNRPGGVMSENDRVRAQVSSQIAAENARLEQLRSRGRREGYSPQ